MADYINFPQCDDPDDTAPASNELNGKKSHVSGHQFLKVESRKGSVQNVEKSITGSGFSEERNCGVEVKSETLTENIRILESGDKSEPTLEIEDCKEKIEFLVNDSLAIDTLKEITSSALLKRAQNETYPNKIHQQIEYQNETNNRKSEIVDEGFEKIESIEGSVSNEFLLVLAFFTFLGFTIIQGVASVYANSKSMMADSEAMAVDVLTYGFNLLAEQKKEKASAHTVLLLELIPPIFSATVLLIITSSNTVDAIKALMNGGSGNEPNVTLMYIFSALNLLLDILNTTCFARANHAFGYKTSDTQNLNSNVVKDSSRADFVTLDEIDYGTFAPQINSKKTSNSKVTINTKLTEEIICDIEYAECLITQDMDTIQDGSASAQTNTGDTKNLNMCAAYTHIMADTLRSIAIFAAAAASTLSSNIASETADSVATIIVSAIVVMSLIPLLQGIFLTWFDYAKMQQQKKSIQ